MSKSREQLALVLRQARLSAGFDSQGKLAKAINLTRPVVVKAESPHGPVPSEVVLTAWARVTGADLAELVELATRCRNGTPEWFMDYKIAEEAAGHLRLWAPLVVPGLLQTPAYARALLSDRPRPAGQLQALVDARVQRQEVLGRAQVTAVIDHAVLHRVPPVGSPAVMAEQCGHLAELVENQLISLHVLRVNVALTGEFAIATRGAVSTVSMTASSRDITSTDATVIDENVRLFDLVLGAALGTVESVEYARAQEEIWKEQA
jgi:hypothetical protein